MVEIWGCNVICFGCDAGKSEIGGLVMFVMEIFQELEMEADAETGSAIGLG